MTVIVLEPSAAGHRLYYVRVLAEGCSEPMQWWTSSEALASRMADVHLQQLLADGRLTVRVVDPWPSSRRALHLASGAGSDLVVVPDGDHWLPAAAATRLLSVLRRGGPVYRLLLMRPELKDMARTPLRVGARRLVKRLLVRSLTRGHSKVQALGLVDAFGYGADHLLDGVVPVSDPVVARQIPAGSTTGDLVVGLLGAVDERKRPALVAAACREAFVEQPGRLVVVGRISVGASAALAQSGLSADQLHLENRYVDEDELVAAAAQCDVIAVMYANHDSSSGVLALAAQVGVPVLVPAGSRLAATAGLGGFGVPAEPTIEGVAMALLELRDQLPGLRLAAREAGRRLGTGDFVQKLTRPAA